MAICPHLSNVLDSAETDTTVEPTETTYSYKTGSGNPGEYDSNGFFHCYEGGECQLWDGINRRCGMKVSDAVVNSDSTNNIPVQLQQLEQILEWANYIVGNSDDFDTTAEHRIGSILRTITHEHNYHSHAIDPDHEHDTTDPTVIATTLVNEFISNYDMDGGKGPGDSVYGRDFMITEDDECPPIVKAIHGHEDWEDPLVSYTWSEYLAL